MRLTVRAYRNRRKLRQNSLYGKGGGWWYRLKRAARNIREFIAYGRDSESDPGPALPPESSTLKAKKTGSYASRMKRKHD
jgi:hypothetical protein